MEHFLLRRERGKTVPVLNKDIQARRPAVKLSQRTKCLDATQSYLTFIAGVDDCIVYTTQAGATYFSTLDGLPIALAHPREMTLKCLITASTLLQVVAIRANKSIKLYKYCLDHLRTGNCVGQELFPDEQFSVSQLVHVDPVTEHIAFLRQETLEVWDMNQQRKMYAHPCRKAWYSSNYVITADEPTLVLVDIGTLRTYSVLLGEDCVVTYAEVTGSYLLFVADAFFAVDLQTQQLLDLSVAHPKLCIQSEFLEDVLIITTNNFSFFLSNPAHEILFDCEDPLFTHLSESLILFENGCLSFIETKSGAVTHVQVPGTDPVTCIGSNSTTGEVYLGTESGSIIIIY